MTYLTARSNLVTCFTMGQTCLNQSSKKIVLEFATNWQGGKGFLLMSKFGVQEVAWNFIHV